MLNESSQKGAPHPASRCISLVPLPRTTTRKSARDIGKQDENSQRSSQKHQPRQLAHSLGPSLWVTVLGGFPVSITHHSAAQSNIVPEGGAEDRPWPQAGYCHPDREVAGDDIPGVKRPLAGEEVDGRQDGEENGPGELYLVHVSLGRGCLPAAASGLVGSSGPSAAQGLEVNHLRGTEARRLELGRLETPDAEHLRSWPGVALCPARHRNKRCWRGTGPLLVLEARA